MNNETPEQLPEALSFLRNNAMFYGPDGFNAYGQFGEDAMAKVLEAYRATAQPVAPEQARPDVAYTPEIVTALINDAFIEWWNSFMSDFELKNILVARLSALASLPPQQVKGYSVDEVRPILRPIIARALGDLVQDRFIDDVMNEAVCALASLSAKGEATDLAQQIAALYHELPPCALKDHLAKWFSLGEAPKTVDPSAWVQRMLTAGEALYRVLENTQVEFAGWSEAEEWEAASKPLYSRVPYVPTNEQYRAAFTGLTDAKFPDAIPEQRAAMWAYDYLATLFAHDPTTQPEAPKGEAPKEDDRIIEVNFGSTVLAKIEVSGSFKVVEAVNGWGNTIDLHNITVTPAAPEGTVSAPVAPDLQALCVGAWPLTSVLEKMIEAAEILLHKKDYDGHGWEEIHHAKEKAKLLLAQTWEQLKREAQLRDQRVSAPVEEREPLQEILQIADNADRNGEDLYKRLRDITEIADNALRAAEPQQTDMNVGQLTAAPSGVVEVLKCVRQFVPRHLWPEIDAALSAAPKEGEQSAEPPADLSKRLRTLRIHLEERFANCSLLMHEKEIRTDIGTVDDAMIALRISNEPRVPFGEASKVELKKGMKHGLYAIYWKSGGFSLASVGFTSDGFNWLAPCNWISQNNELPTVATTDWSAVDRYELLIERDYNRDTIAAPKPNPEPLVAALPNPESILRVRNYFGEHDKTSIEHWAYAFLDKWYASALTQWEASQPSPDSPKN